MTQDASGKRPGREEEFRKQVHDLYRRIEESLDDVDPDQVECERSQGVLTLTLNSSKRPEKIILSIQPALGQLWMAIASTAQAYHFHWEGGRWVEGRDKGLEVWRVLNAYLEKTAGVSLKEGGPMSGETSRIGVYTMEHCPYCVKAKKLLRERGISFTETLVSMDDDAKWDELEKRSGGMQTMPQIYVDGKILGGFSDLDAQDKKDRLQSLK